MILGLRGSLLGGPRGGRFGFVMRMCACMRRLSGDLAKPERQELYSCIPLSGAREERHIHVYQPACDLEVLTRALAWHAGMLALQLQLQKILELTSELLWTCAVHGLRQPVAYSENAHYKCICVNPHRCGCIRTPGPASRHPSRWRCHRPCILTLFMFMQSLRRVSASAHPLSTGLGGWLRHAAAAVVALVVVAVVAIALPAQPLLQIRGAKQSVSTVNAPATSAPRHQDLPHQSTIMFASVIAARSVGVGRIHAKHVHACGEEVPRLDSQQLQAVRDVTVATRATASISQALRDIDAEIGEEVVDDGVVGDEASGASRSLAHVCRRRCGPVSGICTESRGRPDHVRMYQLATARGGKPLRN